jgi:radical SAM protein with 4Fe4S-binding SPASM domain
MLVLSLPIFVFLELTPLCNNRCHGCGNVFDRGNAAQPLASAQWREILGRLKYHVTQVRLTGGEPLLYPELAEVLDALCQVGIGFSLFTNGRWPDPSACIALLRSMAEFSGLLISLHGATAAVHEAFTGVPGSFEETVENVRRARAVGLPVATSTVINRHNYFQTREIVRLSRELGGHHAVFNRYLGPPLPDIEPTEEQLRLAAQEVDAERRLAFGRKLPHIKFGNCIPRCFCPTSSTGCLAGTAYCTIDPWGNVRPCNHAPLVCGNLLEQSMEEIWHGPAMTEWRSKIPSQCQLCEQLEACHGGCRAVALQRGIPADPLMRKPITDKPLAPATPLSLYEGARPLARFALRPDIFGYVLVLGNRLVPVNAEAKPVLDSCNGVTTLSEIRDRFGQGALDFVGSLVSQGLVELSP